MHSASVVHGIKHTLLPCPPEAFETLRRISSISPQATVSAAVNCVVDDKDNTLKGWYCSLPPQTPASIVPFQPNIFEGITVVETLATESQILELLKNKTKIMHTVATFARANQSQSIGDARASWSRCRPARELPLQRTQAWHFVMNKETLARYTTLRDDSVVNVASDIPLELVPDDTLPNYIDSECWEPELGAGGMLGLYHQWYAGDNGTRDLKLYIICQSSCQKAGLEIKQILNDVPKDTTLFDLGVSEELWWLSNVNRRNRNRLIKKLADVLNIEVPVLEDNHANRNDVLMAEPLSHNFLYAIYVAQDGRIGIANECVPTRFASNGIICRLAPWEGVWIFKGPHANYAARFGSAFGNDQTAFPLSTIRLNPSTEALARKMQYVVQNSHPKWHDCWVDARLSSSSTCKPHNDAAFESNDEREDAYERHLTLSEDDVADTRRTFFWDGDPDLYDLALEACARAHATARRNTTKHSHCAAQERHRHRHMSGQEQETASEDLDADVAYISFEDSVLVNKLQESSWHPRYGILKLVPLCVFTN